MGWKKKLKRALGPRPGSPAWKWQQWREMSIGQRTGVVIGVAIIGIAVLFLFYFFFYGPALAQRQMNAINIVRGYEVAKGLAIDQLVQDEVTDSWLAGYPKQAVWGAERETGDQYVVTLQFGIGNPAYKYEHVARWRVNIKTNEIEPLDNGARQYMWL